MKIFRNMSCTIAARTVIRSPRFYRGVVSAIGVAGFACSTSPAFASSPPGTRLVNCDAGTCLMVSGRRDTTASKVRINGHAVAVEGKRKWRILLPMATVRAWSAPLARTIEVGYQNTPMQDAAFEQVDLPIGLMGHSDLAMLVVAAR